MTRRASFYVLFIPWFLVFAIITIGFLGFNVFVSFTDWHNIFPSYHFVGLADYAQMFHTEGFLTTLVNVAILFGAGIPAGLIVSLIVAVAFDLLGSGSAWGSPLRTIAILPMAIGAVIAASFWVWMYEFSDGGINGLLRAVGAGALAVDWLGSPKIVLLMVIVVLVWQFSGFGALILFGALQAIPESHIEAASLEGATTFRLYRQVLLPQIRGHIATLSLLLSMFMLKSFGLVWPMTGGGPGWSSTLFPVLVYREMFGIHDVALGAAVATFMVVVVSVVAIPYIRLTYHET